MKNQSFDISFFEEDPTLTENIQLIVAVKSFDLQAIRKRYLASRNRSKSGSVERRQPAEGGLVLMTIKNGKIIQSEIIAKLIEPRGIDLHRAISAVSSENKIYLFNNQSTAPLIIEHEWLSYIHTVRFNRDSSKLLVSSSGIDSILEFDTKTGEKEWEWNAWENGFNEGENPETGEKHILTRSSADKELYKNIKVMLIDDPKNQTLPTALRAAFINSAEYESSGNIIATFFHHGFVLEISKNDSSQNILFDKLSKPHGGMTNGRHKMVTDTGGGRVILGQSGKKVEYLFSHLPGKAKDVRHLEWLQFSRLHGNNIITIDSNRNSFIIIDIKNQKRMTVSFNPNWALQEFQIIENESLLTIKSMKSWFDTKN